MTADECVAQAMENGLKNIMSELEESRQKMLGTNRTIVMWVTGFTVAVSGWLFVIQMNWIVLAMTAFVGLVVGVIITSRRSGKAGNEFKYRAIPELLRHVMPDFRYCCGGYVEQGEFTATGLFVAPDRYSGKDYFEGYVDKTNMHFSLVHAEERYEITTTVTDEDGHTTTRTEEHWRDIFKGLLFKADFNKHFYGCTVVRSGKAGLLSGFSRTLVKLEDPRFNSCFTVYSNDQVEARYLLTPKMMEQFVGLQESIGGFEASFCGSTINIAAGGFPYDAFEPDVKLSCTNQEQLSRILGWIFTVANIVEDLDLNTRIWTKG